MSIPDKQLMHGAALVPIVGYAQFKALNKQGKGVYTLNDDTPFIVKYARKPNAKGLWPFSFSATELATGRTLSRRYGECYTVLVCYPGTVCLLDWHDLSQIVDVFSLKAEGIRCETPKGKLIRVSSGRTPRGQQLKVAAASFPKKMFQSPSRRKLAVAA